MTNDDPASFSGAEFAKREFATLGQERFWDELERVKWCAGQWLVALVATPNINGVPGDKTMDRLLLTAGTRRLLHKMEIVHLKTKAMPCLIVRLLTSSATIFRHAVRQFVQ